MKDTSFCRLLGMESKYYGDGHGFKVAGVGGTYFSTLTKNQNPRIQLHFTYIIPGGILVLRFKYFGKMKTISMNIGSVKLMIFHFSFLQIKGYHFQHSDIVRKPASVSLE